MTYYTHARADNAGEGLTMLCQNPHASSGCQRDLRGHCVVLRSPQKLNADDVLEDDENNDYVLVCVTTCVFFVSTQCALPNMSAPKVVQAEARAAADQSAFKERLDLEKIWQPAGVGSLALFGVGS